MFIKRARAAGYIVDIWKCIGIHRVMVLLNVPSTRNLNMGTFHLPMIKENGANTYLHYQAVVSFESFEKTLKTIIGRF